MPSYLAFGLFQFSIFPVKTIEESYSCKGLILDTLSSLLKSRPGHNSIVCDIGYLWH